MDVVKAILGFSLTMYCFANLIVSIYVAYLVGERFAKKKKIKVRQLMWVIPFFPSFITGPVLLFVVVAVIAIVYCLWYLVCSIAIMCGNSLVNGVEKIEDWYKEFTVKHREFLDKELF